MLCYNIRRCIDFYNQQRILFKEGSIVEIDRDPSKISWTRGLEGYLKKNIIIEMKNHGRMLTSVYRPFVKTWCYYSRMLNEIPSLWSKIFTDDYVNNRVICVDGTGCKKDFSCLMSNTIFANLPATGTQCFPLYVYNTEEKATKQPIQKSMFGGQENDKDSTNQCNRTSGITDWILDFVNKKYNLVASSPSPIEVSLFW